MSSYSQGKKTFFSSEKLDRALTFFRGKVRKMRNRLEQFERVMPELEMVAGGERPTVRFYEGREALHVLFTDTKLQNGFEVLRGCVMSSTSMTMSYGSFVHVDPWPSRRKIVDQKESKPPKIKVRRNGKIIRVISPPAR